MNIIYGLRDPITDDYRYVGKSTVGLKRAKSHLTYSHNLLVREWISSLIMQEQEPIIDILETCDDSLMLLDKEKYWINKLLLDEHPLLNILVYNTVADKNKELLRLKGELNESIIFLKNKIKKNEIKTIDDIGLMILKRRKFAGLSRNKLSEIAGVGKTVIYDIEHGKTTVQLQILQKILDVLNIKFVFYFGENN